MREAELFTQADQLFTDYVAEITDQQWTKRVPSTPDWTVRQLVNHVAQNNVNTASMLNGGDAEAPDNVLGDAPKDAWIETAQRAEAAAGSKTDGTEAVTGGTVAEILLMQTADRVLHRWDLAHAIGADEAIEPALVQAVYDTVAPNADNARAAGLFGAAVEVGPDASLQDKLLALTGRDPDYTHTEPNDNEQRAEEIHRS